jgi:hypothetical protein
MLKLIIRGFRVKGEKRIGRLVTTKTTKIFPFFLISLEKMERMRKVRDKVRKLGSFGREILS